MENVDWAQAAFSGTGQAQNAFNPTVQARVQSTVAYFGGGLTITGLTAALARGSRFAYINPLWFIIPTFGTLIGMSMTDYNQNPALKQALFGGFTISEGLAMAPLITMFAGPVIFNAAAATAAMVGCLSAYAYFTPTQDFLSMGTGLMIGLCSLLGVSLVNMFWPTPMMTNLMLYGGLLLFGGFVLYDTQKILANAQNKATWDPVQESIGMYLDTIIIF